MASELIISILGLLASIVIGIVQIKISKEQKTLRNQISNLETKISQTGSGNVMRGIIGNSGSTISHNTL